MAEVQKNEPKVYAMAQEVKKEVLLSLELKALRESLGVKQGEVVEKMAVKQSAIARFEKKGYSSKLSTVKEYLASLDCTAELQVTLPDGSKKLMAI